MGKIKPVIIVPTYNERENIVKLVAEIFFHMPNAVVMVVDDNSPDGTGKIVNKLSRKYRGKLMAVHREAKIGRGSAVLEGFKKALAERRFTHFVEMDADFSHDPKELPGLLEVTKDGVMVIASRYLPKSKIINWPLSRHIFSRLANSLARFILGIKIHDCTNGYRAYTKRTIESFPFDQIRETGYAVLLEMIYLFKMAGLDFIEIPTIFVNRGQGKSNTTIYEILDAFVALIRIRFRKRS